MAQDQNYDVIHEDGALIKMWTRGVPVEDGAIRQLKNVARLPFIHGWVAAMPDVHVGMGATIGSVIPTTDAIIPSAVGVDIGCGMMAVRTSIYSEELPAHTHERLFNEISRAVPHGRTDNGGRHDRGAWGDLPPAVEAAWMGLEGGWNEIVRRQRKIGGRVNTARHLGTLGTGNHFIEACVDLDQRVWLVVHSGSRGVGGRIGMYFTKLAQADMKSYYIDLPDRDLAYLPTSTQACRDYLMAVQWAQGFAKANRQLMMDAVKGAVRKVVGHRFDTDEEVDCHHNYVAQERHYGKNVWLTRKGAINAERGRMGIIPGSMGERSYIVSGLGNREAYNTCSHGAGRLMSRGVAKRELTLKQHRAATEGVTCKKDGSVLDETPGAYKDIEAVMAAQSDLVEVRYQLKQFVCVKG